MCVDIFVWDVFKFSFIVDMYVHPFNSLGYDETLVLQTNKQHYFGEWSSFCWSA